MRLNSVMTLPLQGTFGGLAVAAVLGSVFHLIANFHPSWKLLLYPAQWTALFLLLRPLLRLKSVEMRESGLVVGGLFSQATIPFGSIASEATVAPGRGCTFVTLFLNDPSIFGDQITFMPDMGVEVDENQKLTILARNTQMRFYRRGWLDRLLGRTRKPGPSNNAQ